MDKGRRAVYPDHMPDAAGERLIEVAGLSVARGVDPPLIRDGLCFVAHLIGRELHANADVRGKLQTAYNALAKYKQTEKDLVAMGFPTPDRPNDWLESAMRELFLWIDRPMPTSRRPELRTELYPYLLALCQLTFGNKPTAFYDHGRDKDGPTLSFIRQAAREIDEAYEQLILPLGKSAAFRFGDGTTGTLFATLPQGDSLRSAIEASLPPREEEPVHDLQGPRSSDAVNEGQFLFALEALQLVILPRVAP